MQPIKLCPYCREEIKYDAIKCKHCGATLVTPGPSFTSISKVSMALAERYQVIEQRGRGGMAVIYKATQRNLQRTVALKVLHPHYATDKDFLERFHREARSAASLSHPNIVTIYDEGMESDVHYISMEYLDGKDLEQLMQEHIVQDRKFSLREVIEMVVPVARALDFAHKWGIYHRDVKCSNIFVCDDGRVKLTDFGIAHAAEGTLLTQDGENLGTPEYMSPEQVSTVKVDGRTDIWSFGVVLYYVMTGEFPFKGGNQLGTMYKILNDPPKPIDRRQEVSGGVQEIIKGCLEKNVEVRIQSGAELVERLLKLDKKPVPSKPAPIRKQSRSRVMVIAFGILVIAASIVVALMSEPAPSPPPAPPIGEILMPNLQGKSEIEVRSILDSAELILGEVIHGSSLNNQGVYYQSPEIGALARPGDTVEVWIAGPRFQASETTKSPE